MSVLRRNAAIFHFALLLARAVAGTRSVRAAVIADLTPDTFSSEYARGVLLALRKPQCASLVPTQASDDSGNSTLALEILARTTTFLSGNVSVVFAAAPTFLDLFRFRASSPTAEDPLFFALRTGDIMPVGANRLIALRGGPKAEILAAVDHALKTGCRTFGLLADSGAIARGLGEDFNRNLDVLGAVPHSVWTFERAGDVKGEVEKILEVVFPPDVLFFSGDLEATRAFVPLAFRSGLRCVLLSVSSLNPWQMEIPPEGERKGRLYVASVVPFFQHRESNPPPLIYSRFREAALASGLALSPHSYEGFLAGSLLCQAVRQGVLDDADSWCPANASTARCLEIAIRHREHTFVLDGGVQVGPYGVTDPCNESCPVWAGLRRVELAEYSVAANDWQVVPNSIHTWSCCDAADGPLGFLTRLGKTSDLTWLADAGPALDLGILTALRSWRHGPTAVLISLDDRYGLQAAINNTRYLAESRNVLGLLCCMGTGPGEAIAGILAEDKVPFIAPFTAGAVLHSKIDFIREVVNVRPKHSDEIVTLMSFVLDRLNLTRICVVGADTEYTRLLASSASEYVCGRGLPPVHQVLGQYLANSTTHHGAAELVANWGSEVVLVVGLKTNVIAFLVALKARLPPATVYLLTSVAELRGVVEDLASRGVDTGNIFSSEIVPSWEDEGHPLVREFNALVPEPKRNWVVLEGYVSAQLVLRILKLMEFDPKGSDPRASFLKHVYSGEVFNISGFLLGPYKDWPCDSKTSCSASRCNTGSKTVWLVRVDRDNDTGRFSFPVVDVSVYLPCGLDLPTGACARSSSSSSSPAPVTHTRGLRGTEALAIVIPVVCASLVAVVGAVVSLVVLYRRRSSKSRDVRTTSFAEVSLGRMVDAALFNSPPSDLLSVEELFDPAQSRLVRMSELGLQMSPPKITFGLPADQPLPVNAPLAQEITLSLLPSQQRSRVEVSVHVPLPVACKYAVSLSFPTAPSSSSSSMPLVVHKGQPAAFVLELQVHCTMRLRAELFLECPKEGSYSVVPLEAQSALSMFLDPDEVVLSDLVLGAGSFAKVFKGQWRGIECAVKVLNCQVLTVVERDEFTRELDLMNKCRHPNVVGFVGGVVVPGRLAILTELLKMGNLKNVMSTEFVSKVLKLRIALDVARGMQFLHESSVIHRDLKPDNVLVASLSLRAASVAKISDFGSCRNTVSQDLARSYTQAVGTPIYQAPEVLSGQPYSNKEDVFSFGVTLWELMTEEEPYASFVSTWEIAKFVGQGKRLTTSPRAQGRQEEEDQIRHALVVSSPVSPPDHNRPHMTYKPQYRIFRSFQ